MKQTKEDTARKLLQLGMDYEKISSITELKKNLTATTEMKAF